MTRQRFLFIAFLLLLLPVSAQAQNVETTDDLKLEFEGAGLLSSDLKGALPKALWRDQPRSEITYLLENLPAEAPLRSIQEIKRNMLISTYDTSLIKNDIEIKPGKDLLSLRLKKLMEMGFWEDGVRLYTQNIEDPGNNDGLAQIGVELILNQKGLSTACLEEKVIASRFDKNPFWNQIDTVCDAEIGSNTVLSTEFPDSAVLKAIYTEPAFVIHAKDIAALRKLSPLEFSLLIMKKKIDYKQIDLSVDIPPYITKIFLSDLNFPADQRDSLEKIAIRQALLPVPPLPAKVENVDIAPENIATGVERLSQPEIVELVSHKLISGQKITIEETERLAALAPEFPENHFYIQILKTIQATDSPVPVSEENLQAGTEIVSARSPRKVNLLKSLLDKPEKLSNNPAEVYEKQISLTPEGHYVMPTGRWAEWLEKTKKYHFVGLGLLIILSNVEVDADAKNSGDIPEKDTSNVLKSLSTVGLIDQAHHIAKEELAKLMGRY